MEDAETGATRSTWGTFDRLLERSATFRQNVGVAFDTTVPAPQRQGAIDSLRQRLESDPARQLIRARVAGGRKGTWVDELSIQTAILSQRTFDWFTPVHSRHHILFVPLVCLTATYFFRYVLQPTRARLCCRTYCRNPSCAVAVTCLEPSRRPCCRRRPAARLIRSP